MNAAETYLYEIIKLLNQYPTSKTPDDAIRFLELQMNDEDRSLYKQHVFLQDLPFTNLVDLEGLEEELDSWLDLQQINPNPATLDFEQLCTFLKHFICKIHSDRYVESVYMRKQITYAFGILCKKLLSFPVFIHINEPSFLTLNLVEQYRYLLIVIGEKLAAYYELADPPKAPYTLWKHFMNFNAESIQEQDLDIINVWPYLNDTQSIDMGDTEPYFYSDSDDEL